MKIIDGYCDYAWEKELTILMIKMANLSKYKPILVDGMTLNKEEKAAFKKAEDDYCLFKSGLLFIFSEWMYKERIAAAFKNLTLKQQSNFYAYYRSFREEALNHGFLAEYDLIMQSLKPAGNKVAKAIEYLTEAIDYLVYGSFLFYAYYSTNSFFITLGIFIFFYELYAIRAKIILLFDLSKKDVTNTFQADLIIRKLNSELIDDNINFAREQLIKAKWLTSEGEVNEDETNINS
ncbi:MAG: hypothetical protein K2X90_02875 [Candidatus Babeliaceae bacterium]|nr:hypothetical protein [Candidatus Babeliaceae bacterium]